MNIDTRDTLRRHGIQPTAQRMAVAECVLQAANHPTADDVWSEVQARLPVISRATVYNTLNLFVAHGLLRAVVLKPGTVVFDPNLERHHHFIDIETGAIHDVSWDRLRVEGVEDLEDLDIDQVEVVLRGRPRS